MADKYYAVKAGLKTGIFDTWEECKANVYGYSGAVYKSFKTRAEAMTYLEEGVKNKDALAAGEILEVKDVSDSEDCVKIYVDGSYNSLTEEFSYGMVVLSGDGEKKFNGRFNDRELASMRNVAGEIKGAEAAMQYALDHNLAEIEIYHDYEGIARWCLGEWKTNREGTRAYKDFYDRASGKVKIRFAKVTGHSGDKYNDMADELAKEALAGRIYE